MILIENCAVATMDAAGTEHGDGHVVVGDDGRIVAVGSGHGGRSQSVAQRADPCVVVAARRPRRASPRPPRSRGVASTPESTAV